MENRRKTKKTLYEMYQAFTKVRTCWTQEDHETGINDASLKTPNFPTLLFYVKVIKVSKNFKIISVIIQFHPYSSSFRTLGYRS